MNSVDYSRRLRDWIPHRRGPAWGGRLVLGRLALVAIVVGVMLQAIPAAAQNKGAAQVLFEAGRRAAADGDYVTACQKFEESNRMEPAIGTLLNLGNCEEQQGHWATSWLRYTEALTKLAPEDKRYVFAKGKADALEPKIPRLVILLDESVPPGTTVSRNGSPLTVAFGSPMRLDPGKYTIRVEAPEHRPATYEVVLFEGDEERLSVAPGERIRQEPPPGQRISPVETRKANTRRTLGYAFGGAGAAAGLAAITFGVLTFTEYLTAKDHCDHVSGGWSCRDTTGDNAIGKGQTYELIAYGLGAVGLASMGVGAYFLLSDSPSGTTAVSAGRFGDTLGFNLRHTF